MPDDLRDDWGFTEADHAELEALSKKYDARLQEIFTELIEQGGITAMPDDPGFMGWMARTQPAGAKMRVFPKGGLWWTLLDRLRELDNDDNEKRGA
jgi:hypothetical protein